MLAGVARGLVDFDWLACEYVEITMRDAPDEYADVSVVQQGPEHAIETPF
ncbi:hypothetical protein [Gemmatimonas sp.]